MTRVVRNTEPLGQPEISDPQPSFRPCQKELGTMIWDIEPGLVEASLVWGYGTWVEGD